MEDNKNNLLYENTTTYTKDLYLDFTKFHLRKRSLATAIPLYVCMIIMSISSILLIVLNLDVKAGIAFLILSLAIIIMYIYLPNISVSKILKFDKTFEGTKNTYKFFDSYLEVSNNYGSTKLEYENLYKIYETNSNFYLYINSRQAFLVNKSGFKTNIDEISEFFKNKFGENYLKK